MAVHRVPVRPTFKKVPPPPAILATTQALARAPTILSNTHGTITGGSFQTGTTYKGKEYFFFNKQNAIQLEMKQQPFLIPFNRLPQIRLSKPEDN